MAGVIGAACFDPMRPTVGRLLVAGCAAGTFVEGGVDSGFHELADKSGGVEIRNTRLLGSRILLTNACLQSSEFGLQALEFFSLIHVGRLLRRGLA